MDGTYQRFLENTRIEASELEGKSRLFRLHGMPPSPSSRYQLTFDLAYLRRTASGTVERANGPVHCLLHFPGDYLRSADPKLYLKVAFMLTSQFVHPNVRDGSICLGVNFAPGSPITAVVWQVFDIVTYRNNTVDERNALNPEACRLLRARPELIDQLDRPPLFGRKHDWRTKVIAR
jgi:hypothetical protein